MAILDASMVKQPRWILAIVVGVVITAGFVRLGFWQLDRLDQRRETNATIEGRLSEPSRPLEGILGHYGDDVDEMLYRRARVEGVYRIDDEFVSIGRIVSDESGILVATPLDLADGSVLIIVRGLVPPDTSGPPAQGYEPPLGTVSLVGRIDDGEEPLRIGEPAPQDGHLEALSRIDLAYIDQWVDGDVLPITLILEEQSPIDRGAGPIRVPTDELTEGSHLGYAIQWFSFAIIVGVGVGLLVHRAGTRDDPNEADPDRASLL